MNKFQNLFCIDIDFSNEHAGDILSIDVGRCEDIYCTVQKSSRIINYIKFWLDPAADWGFLLVGLAYSTIKMIRVWSADAIGYSSLARALH